MTCGNILAVLFTTALLGWSSHAHAAAYIEKDGRYEINWSTGKLRFYGVGKLNADDPNFRTAEQLAWADGLKAAEKNVPALFSGRLGKVASSNPEKISKLAAATVSVSTTYFGDQRVKVLLEASVNKFTPQMVLESSGASQAATQPGDGVLVIRLPKQAKPVAFVQIVDENGREMLAASDVASAVRAGGAISRWYKREAAFEGGEKSAQMNEIKAEYAAPGVIKVASSAWRPEYAAAIVAGRGLFVVE